MVVLQELFLLGSDETLNRQQGNFAFHRNFLYHRPWCNSSGFSRQEEGAPPLELSADFLFHTSPSWSYSPPSLAIARREKMHRRPCQHTREGLGGDNFSRHVIRVTYRRWYRVSSTAIGGSLTRRKRQESSLCVRHTLSAEELEDE